MLIGFTVMQHAFAGGITHGIVSDVERRALALTGAGDMIWDWDVSADKVFTSPETEQLLGLKRGSLEGPAARWLDVLHPLDRDRFRAALDSVLEQRRGRLMQDFRLRTPDGHYLWFALKARPVVGSDGEVVRLVGTLTDVTEFKNAEERLLHDAVHDNLTGLPNRELFVDRLEVGAGARQGRSGDPADGGGHRPRPLQAGQRLGRHRGRRFDPADAGAPARPAAQAAGHAGAAVRRPVRADPAVGEANPSAIIAFAETLRRALRAPITFNDREIFLTASIGIALADGQPNRSRGGAQGRRACDVSLQAHRRRPHRGVQAVDARAQDRPAHARIRAAPRARARGDHHPLPADRAAGGPLGRGLRGAGALGPSQDGPHVAVGIHHHRRGDRPDRRSRPVRAGAHRAPARPVAAHGAPARSGVLPASTCRRASCCGRTWSTTCAR